jgi:hypothetical protein
MSDMLQLVVRRIHCQLCNRPVISHLPFPSIWHFARDDDNLKIVEHRVLNSDRYVEVSCTDHRR